MIKVIVNLKAEDIQIVAINKYNNIVFVCDCEQSQLGGNLKKLVETFGNIKINFIVTPIVLKDNNNMIVLNKFFVQNSQMFCCMSHEDIEQIKTLCLAVGLNEFTLISKFSLLSTIGKIKETLILGEYINKERYAIHISKENKYIIDDFRCFNKFDSRVITSMSNRYNCECICEYNDSMFALLEKNYTNFNSMDEDSKLTLSIPLLANFKKPDKVVSVVQEGVNVDNDIDKIVDTADREYENPHNTSTVPSSEYRTEDNKLGMIPEKTENPSRTKPKNLVRYVGIVFSIFLGISVVSNTVCGGALDHYINLNSEVLQFKDGVAEKEEFLNNVINKENLGIEVQTTKAIEGLGVKVSDLYFNGLEATLTTSITKKEELEDVVKKVQTILPNAEGKIITESKNEIEVEITGQRFKNLAKTEKED